MSFVSNFNLPVSWRKISFSMLMFTSLMLLIIWSGIFVIDINLFSGIKVKTSVSSNVVELKMSQNISEYSPMTVIERIEYYLTPKWYSYFTNAMNNNNSNAMNININISLFTPPIKEYHHRVNLLEYTLVSEKRLKNLKKRNSCSLACTDILKLLMLPSMKECKYYNENSKFIVEFGDDAHWQPKYYPSTIPIFLKSRYVNEENAMLLKLRVERHFIFYSDVEKYDIPWEEKKSHLVWRGTMTGFFPNEYRFAIVDKYMKYNEKHNNTNVSIDIAFSQRNQNFRFFNKDGLKPLRLIGGVITMEQLLQSKYLVTIPGNDVATNFNWILFSNSVPFVFRLPPKQRKHEKETWTMHGLTQPYVHYIPFTLNNDDDDSLIKGYEFCESHPKNCSRIAQNGKLWMMQFRDIKREEEIQTRMLSLYCNAIQIK